MNPFDAAITLLALLAVVTGFNAGLLRSLATILAYLIAAPFALALTPTVAAFLARATSSRRTWPILCRSCCCWRSASCSAR